MAPRGELHPRWDLHGESTHKYRGQQAFVAGLIGTVAARSSSPLGLLDVGCGGGGLRAALVELGLVPERIAYTGVEYGAEVVASSRRALPDVEVLEASIEALPVADGAFDVAVAQGVLETLPSYEPAVRELLRVSSWCVLVTLTHVGHGERGHGHAPAVGFYPSTAWNADGLLRYARDNGASYAFVVNRGAGDDARANHVLVFLK
jgi:SAM-dependent methyltransferase